MSVPQSDSLLQVETTCGSLLYELQIIWDEVGESDTERDKMLLELEQECLEVYRRKVDTANRCRAHLKQGIADAEAELAAICSAMGERPVHIRQSDQSPGSLKAELRTILPQLEEMQKRKLDRRNQFFEVLEQIQKIRNEIYRPDKLAAVSTVVDETDLSLRKLEELHRELQSLQKEKSDRLKQVLDYLNSLSSLCLVLGMDFQQTVNEVHPSLGNSEGTKSISNDTIESLAVAIQRFREIKIQRMQRLQDLATSMLELWNLMDTPIEEQQMFQNVTCNIAASEHEIKEPNMLSVDFINYVEAEVFRLEELKASKMKELVFKKRSELEEICRKTHMIPESDSAMEIAIEAIETGAVDAAYILEQIELQIGKVKEEALSRKEILEKVEKWMVACEEECWLEEYNRDDNRYNAGRGAHLTLKRAEKARALVNKLQGMVETLALKITAWENERGTEFSYDGVRLLSMLEEYNILRQEKEQERKRQRDQKKLQGQLIAEQEALFGSKPSPMKPQSVKKGPRLSCGGGASNRRLSLGGAMLQTPKADPLHSVKGTPNTRQTKKNERLHQNDKLNHQRDDGVAALSAGRRGLDIAGLPVKKHSFNAVNAHEAESPMVRKPFSPISSTESSKANAANFLEDLNRKQNETSQKTIPSNITPFATPSKLVSATAEEENRTPKTMAMPVPSTTTPSTVSIPMQTLMTPVACRGAAATRVAARSENPVQFSESTTPVLPFSASTALVAAAAPIAVLAPPVAAQPQAMAAPPATPVSGATPGTELKKKRGRPRKYGPDGKPAVALSPMPISASIPLTADYSTWKHNRGQPIDSYKKKHKLEFESPGERVAYSVGANFTPHVITVNAGEDVTMKIISFSQQGSRAICILAANGAISNVTLRQPNSSGGTLTYEGRFEILSLSGSFMPTDSGGTKSRTGGMSVSLAGPDGRVLGGGIAGLLVAAGPVQVVIGSFLPGHQQEQKPKKQKFEFAKAFSPVPANHISGEGTDGVYSGTKPNLSPASYHGDNLGSGNPFHGSKVFGAENNVSLPGESKDLSPTKCMVFC